MKEAVKFLFSLVSLSVCTVLGFDRVPWWGTLCISLGCAFVTALVVWFVVCPRLEKKIKREYIHTFGLHGELAYNVEH